MAKPPLHRMREVSGFELMDDAVTLLRQLPARAWAVYVPCVLWAVFGLLRLLFASPREDLASLALTATAGFGAKQISECWLARELWTLLQRDPAPRRLPWISVLLRQTAWQPWSIAVLPLGLLAAVPFPYAVWFFRNLSLNVARGEAHAVAVAWEDSRAAQSQSWTFLTGTLLAALLLYLNLLFSAIAIPVLVRMFTGFESVWAAPSVLLRSGALHGIIVGIVYLLLDALFTAAAVIRVFANRSRTTGEDLLLALKRLSAPAAAMLLIAVLVAAPLAAAPVDRQELNDSIDRTLERAEFLWRVPAQDPGQVPGWWKQVEAWWNKLSDWVRQFFDWLDKWLRPLTGRQPANAPAGDAGGASRNILVLLAGITVLAVIYFVWRRIRQQPPETIDAQAAPSVDIRDESVSAEQLPEEGWLRMAEEFLANGEFRLALRAIHLAGLRRLSQSQLLTLKRWKSGMDYQAELRRKSRGSVQLNSEFLEVWRDFDYGWYGHRPVEASHVSRFRERWEAVRAHAS
ncbi:MAG: hypothetical protein FJW39_12730 [Acidobacteria bacterium]|nr:hypothetical protein [Acidobacteriota bacterium]